MARKRAAGATPAVQALERAGVRHVVHPYEHDPRAESYGVEAAEVLGVDPERVFKTLVVDVDGRLVVGVVPVSARLDLKALARAVGGRKAAMADPAAAQRVTGYVVGGISPLGQKRPHRTSSTRRPSTTTPSWSPPGVVAWTSSSRRATWSP